MEMDRDRGGRERGGRRRNRGRQVRDFIPINCDIAPWLQLFKD